MTCAEPAKGRARPETDGAVLRLCAVLRMEKFAGEMIRFVGSPDGGIVPDLAGKLPGRGVWVTATKPMVAAAVARNVFAKSLKRRVEVDSGLPDPVERLLLERVRQALSFANKAGLVTTGYMKVDKAIEAGTVAILIQAADGRDGGIERLAAKFRGLAGMSGDATPVIRELTGDDLGLAIGRETVVHAGLAKGGQSGIFLRECRRLGHYRLSADEAVGAVADTVSGSEMVSSTGQASTGKA